MGNKVVRDPVHGYISIDDRLCQFFIDTPIFQRLRSIEQTSMRCLFPGGRHDRFIHSLGVYHLAQRLYDRLKENSHKDVHSILVDAGLEHTFIIAALMHDCGHAPFSHTSEYFYNQCGYSGRFHNLTYNHLQDVVDKKAREDFDFAGVKKKPADHEAMSAYVLLACYPDALKVMDVDPTLAARMVTGVRHRMPQNLRERVENILIQLINGDAIDVDKLDYIIRDTWASGVKNAAIDVGRLLDAAIIEMEAGKPRFSYLSSALSVIQTVVDARNYLYEWIYGHHTVVYYAELLKRLCLRLGMALSKEDREAADKLLSEMFSTKIFNGCGSVDSQLVGKVCIRYLNDGDVMSLMKRTIGDDRLYKAYSSHVPAHFPLWKTEAEYKVCVAKDKRQAFDPEKCVALLRDKYSLPIDCCFYCKGMSGKIYDITPSAVQIKMNNGEIHSYADIGNITKHPSISDNTASPFCYVFVDVSNLEKRKEMLEFINDYEW